MEEECQVKAVLVRLEIFFQICGFTSFDLLDHFIHFHEYFFSKFGDLQDLIVLMTF